jgi:hypothetical protein
MIREIPRYPDAKFLGTSLIMLCVYLLDMYNNLALLALEAY